MASQDFIVAIAQALREVIRPLEDAFLTQGAANMLLLRHGWAPPTDDTDLAALNAHFDVASRVSALATALDEVTGQPDPAVTEVEAALQAGIGILEWILDMASSPVPAGFTGALAATDFWNQFPRDLHASLLSDYLRVLHPGAFALLRLGGVIRQTRVPAADRPGRVDFTRTDIRWSRLADVVLNPASIAGEEYGWGGNVLDHRALFARLQEVLAAFGINTGTVRLARHPLVASYYADGNAALDDLTMFHATLFYEEDLDGQGVEVAFEVLPIPPKEQPNGAPSGLLIAPAVIGTSATNYPLGGAFSLELAGGFELDSPVGIELRPNGVDVAGSTTGEAIGATFHARPRDPWVLIGTRNSIRLEVQAFSFSLQASGLPSDRELKLRLAADTIRLVLDRNGFDGFLKDALSDMPDSTEGSAAIVWSSKTGLTFDGSSSLALKFSLNRSFGPLRLDSLGLAIVAGDQAVKTTATLTARAKIGPLAAIIDAVGIETSLAFPPDGGNFGGTDLDFGFKPPSGIGLSVDAQGVLTGGGFLFHDPARQLYAGAMQLSLHDELTLSAYGLIATRLPDGRPGYSLLIFITADGFKPIPLGFGFMLQSIGGMVGIHRTFDLKALRAGLKTGSLRTLLLPQDPVANAPALIQALAAAFPAQRGSYLLGLLARITWFTPTLVRMDLALIRELGSRDRLLVLGRVSALLPSADNDLIRLNLDALGVLDFDAGTLEADAVLVDSRLAHRFPITGSGALRARWPGIGGAAGTAGPAIAGTHFVLAVGGLNPRFHAPAGFPALDRLTLALCSGDNPRLICDAYFAITANTVQFGAHASLHARASKITVNGDLGFDALVTVVPPRFVVDFHASVQLKYKSHNLFKVALDGTLEGPLPLRIAARAKFEILWFSFSVRFDFTLAGFLGSGGGPVSVSLEAELKKALGDPANWSTRRAPGVAHGVALRSLPRDAGLVLDPLGQLLVEQQLVPLNTGRDIDTYGGAPVTGARRFSLAGGLKSAPSAPAQPVQGAFAPARYFTMSDDEKLAAPSFEQRDAGLVLGEGTVSFGPETKASLGYNTITLPPSPSAGTGASGLAAAEAAAPPVYEMPWSLLEAQCPGGAAARAPVRNAGRARFRNTAATPAVLLKAPGWRVVPVSGAEARLGGEPGPGTWSDCHAALAELNRGGARWRMVPDYELAV